MTDTPQMVSTAAVQADGEDGHVSDSAALASYLQQMKLDRAGQKDGSRTGQPSHFVGGPSSPRRHDSESCLLSCTIPHVFLIACSFLIMLFCSLLPMWGPRASCRCSAAPRCFNRGHSSWPTFPADACHTHLVQR